MQSASASHPLVLLGWRMLWPWKNCLSGHPGASIFWCVENCILVGTWAESCTENCLGGCDIGYHVPCYDLLPEPFYQYQSRHDLLFLVYGSDRLWLCPLVQYVLLPPIEVWNKRRTCSLLYRRYESVFRVALALYFDCELMYFLYYLRGNLH